MLLIGGISGCLNKNVRKLEKTLFSKLYQKWFTFHLCVFIFNYSIHLRIYFCKAYLENVLVSTYFSPGRFGQRNPGISLNFLYSVPASRGGYNNGRAGHHTAATGKSVFPSL
jgi:hypothetical protein